MAAIAELNLELSVTASDGSGLAQHWHPSPSIRWAPGVTSGKREVVTLTASASTALSVPSGAKAVAILLGTSNISLTLKGAAGDTGIAITPASAALGIPVILPLNNGGSPVIVITNGDSSQTVEVIWF